MEKEPMKNIDIIVRTVCTTLSKNRNTKIKQKH
jgi:hypothetical protein